MRTLENWGRLLRAAPYSRPKFNCTASDRAAQQRSGLSTFDMKVTHSRYIQGVDPSVTISL